jgi:hypothetical protein
VVGVVGGGSDDASSAGILDDAVRCKQTLVRDRDLICIAPASVLTELPPADREARLAKTRALAQFAGMNRVIFEDNGRVWRTLVLHSPGLPGPKEQKAAATTTKAPEPPPKSSSPSGPIDAVPN